MKGILGDLRDGLLGQGHGWNKEELDTALHARAAIDMLAGMMRDRGASIDPEAVEAEAWGASFEGCVTKYSCHFRRLLGLSHPIEIVFDKTVPDSYFLLEATQWERVLLRDDLCLFLFNIEGRTVALFVTTSQSLASPATWVGVPVAPDATMVMTKWEGRLWPAPVEEKTPQQSIGLYEPPQELVHVMGDKLYVPINAGMAYRLAKAPAYIFAPLSMSFEQFRALSFSEPTADSLR
jgi:hypothetical protein